MSNTRKKILLLAANPEDTTRLRLDKEVREIQEGLKLSKYRDHFEIEQRWAVRIRDLRRSILDYKPSIIHFSGHAEVQGIMLEDEQGDAVLVKSEALSGLFEILSEGVECVILNACFSLSQAKAIAEHIDYVIGMKEEIGDDAAIEFSIGFYDGLGAGKSVEQAYKLGCNAIQLQNIPEHLTPVFIKKSDVSGEVLSKTAQKRIFLSYKRNGDPDEHLADAVLESLRNAGHYVFIDRDIPLGIDWVKRIDAELEQADFLISLLSPNSVNSEMVKAEIEKAHDLAKERDGKPRILPVRVQYREPFNYPLNAYLNHINWALWDSEQDTPHLIEMLSGAISGEPLPVQRDHHSDVLQKNRVFGLHAPTYAAQPLQLEMPEGTMDPESYFYIERPTDQVALQAIARQGVTITIKAPRQMGKSSLLMRTIKAASEAGKELAFLDFQLFNKPALSDADTFFRQICSWLSDELDLDDKVDEYWDMPLGNAQRCTRYMQRNILKEVGKPLVLAMDEVETIFDTDFRSDFFGMLRSWHNKRVTGRIWKNLDLALVTSTEPYQLIENLNQSPFNVGERIALEDFTAGQVSDLNYRHKAPFNSQEEHRLMDLLSGHPYLTRRAMYLVASKRCTVKELFANAIEDTGPFGDHLRHHLFRIHDKKELVWGLHQVIKDHTCQDERIVFRLQGAGLVKRARGNIVVPRCKLYAEYFKARLHG